MKKVSSAVLVMFLMLTALNGAHATTYKFSPFSYNCMGINNAGTVVGYFLDGTGWHGFTKSGVTVTTLDYPGITGNTRAMGMSGNGAVAGSYTDDTGSSFGFKKVGSVYTQLKDYPDASGVNDSGTVVGSYWDSKARFHGYSLGAATSAVIDYPNAHDTYANGINNAGVIVGSYIDTAGNTHGFSLTSSAFKSIDYPDAISTVATGINDDGVIVGYYSNTAGVTDGYHGFSLSGSAYATIDHPAAIQNWANGTRIFGVNDSGEIVGLVNGDSYFLGIPDTGPALELNVALSGKGKGSVTSDPAGIECGSACKASFAKEGTVKLTAQPADDYSQFSKWSGCTTSSGNECSVVMTAKKQVTATFTPTPTYQLTVSQGHTNGGKGKVTSDDLKINCGTDCKEKYLKNTAITLSAVADAGSVFKGWKPATSPCATTAPCAVTMDKAKAVQAVFVGDYTLKVASKSQKLKKVSGTGKVTYTPAAINCATGSTSHCSGKVPYHTSVTLTATPDTGSELKGWSACPSASGQTCTFTMDKAFSITATFKPKTD